MLRRRPRSAPFPTRRSSDLQVRREPVHRLRQVFPRAAHALDLRLAAELALLADLACDPRDLVGERGELVDHRVDGLDRKSTRLNSSHRTISYAVFRLKKKKP